MTNKCGNGDGLPADYAGHPTVDPTANVIALVTADKERADDLRAWEIKFFDYALASVKEIATINASHVRDVAALRSAHLTELRTNDIAMQANIRQVDIINANSAAAQTQVAIQTLAKSSAETASALAKQLSDTNARYDERLRMLESGASKGEGKGVGIEKMYGWIIAAIAVLWAIFGQYFK